MLALGRANNRGLWGWLLVMTVLAVVWQVWTFLTLNGLRNNLL
jgi:hypothetical protein